MNFTTKPPLYIAFLWHMHQPYYKDLTNKYILPWVRLHGIKDYYGVPRLIEDIPEARLTFSLTPSLLEQIYDYSIKLEQDLFIELTLKAVEEYSTEERIFILKNFFLANWDTMVKVYPRYAQLLEKRGYYFSDEELKIKQKFFSTQEMIDLKVWYNLAWIDTGFQRNDKRISELIAKGRNFTRSDLETLVDVQKEIISKIIPQYKKLMESGQAELITTPFYHPILPLLYDTSLARIAVPDIILPERGFSYPEDCKAQLNMAVTYYQSIFGKKPKGLWPSEGAVFKELVPMLNENNIEWIATDEDILAKSINISLERDIHGCLKDPSILYKPYWIYKGEQRIIGIFRDSVLSDLIGFVYYRWDIERAVEDFCGRLRMIHQRSLSFERPALVTIILDGENAWEFYPHNGRDFLARLYENITGDNDFKMTTISEYLNQYPPSKEDRIEKLFPGSWINHNFKVWIGHEEDNKAWQYLISARRAIEEHKSKSEQTLETIKKELYIAEGSDWFWWYGDDHFTEQADLFDYIYRKHLINIYHLLELPVPNELHIPITINRVKSEFRCQPRGYITPIIDGKINSYFEWLMAVRFKVKKSGGTIHRSESILKDIFYGFDEDYLYLRLDTSRPFKELDITICLHIIYPKLLLIKIYKDPATSLFCGHIIMDDKDIGKVDNVRCGKILEMGIPFKDIGGEQGSKIRFVVAVEREENEIERWPLQGYLLLTRPYPGYEDNFWLP